MLSVKLKDFLLSGPIYDNNETDEGTSNGIHKNSKLLLSEWNSYKEEELERRSLFKKVLNEIHEFQSKTTDTVLETKIRSYSSLQNRIQLLSLAKKISDLQQFLNVQDMPDLILDVIDYVPQYLPKGCIIEKMLIQTVSTLKESLLFSFHKEFEVHLEGNRDENDAKKLWSNFLGIARDWLLAYALVSLLPIVISDSRSLILEKYTDALDEALTPLWGRFHFHLGSARESQSFEQVLWTFSYAKSFVTLLNDLCTQLTDTGKLQKLHQGDYKEAALNHISDKAVRFMRAHLAQIIIDNSPMSTEICMQLVEHSLEFDDSIAAFYQPPISVR